MVARGSPSISRKRSSRRGCLDERRARYREHANTRTHEASGAMFVCSCVRVAPGGNRMSMLMPPFELHEPTSVKEACELKARLPESDFVAGGTDLLPNYEWGLSVRKHVISLARVAGLRDITPERVGALATLTHIEQSAALAHALPVLPETARQIATPLLRNAGTLGGNLMLENRCFFFNQTYFWRESKGFCLKADGDACLVVPQKEKCYATFSADMPAPLIALRAKVHLASANGEREMPLADFYRGDGIERNVKRPDEMVVGVKIPREAQAFRAT